jgi:predicted enzyme related to lactoylglutathione lyase
MIEPIGHGAPTQRATSPSGSYERRAPSANPRPNRAQMITGVHTVLYTRDASADRAFFRDVLELRFEDAGDGWLIFALPPAELAAHPADENGRHELYLMCDDIKATVAELSVRGAEIARPVTDEGFGRVTAIRLPGGGELGLYEPQHQSPLRSP